VSSFSEHDDAGVLFGALSAVLAALASGNQLTPAELIARAIGGGLGGKLGALVPDLLEPPTSSWHRSTAHSALATCAVAHAGVKRIAPAAERWLTDARASPGSAHSMFTHLVAGMAMGVPAGYVSHTMLDAGTPRSIPLITRGF
jgi:hypothetical protein